MSVFIYYISRSPEHGGHPVLTPEGIHAGFVRAEPAKKGDVLEALDQADPKPGESVMNTHDLDDLAEDK